MTQPSCAIHWYTFTSTSPLELVMDTIGGTFSQIQARGGFGHPISYEHESGTSIFTGSKRPDQPIVINAPGQVCEDWSDHLVACSVALAATVTRVDLAVDLEPHQLARRRLVQMRRAWKRQKVQTAMQWSSHDWQQSEEVNGGATAYFGGKLAAIRLCAYDRRGPLRLEWRFRPERQIGKFVPLMLHDSGPPALWRRLAQSAIFPMDWYQELLEGPKVEWQAPLRQVSDLTKVLESLQQQVGTTLYAMQLLGLTLADLAVPPERPRGEILRRWNRWADDAKELGYDGAKLKQEIKCKSKSRRVCV